METRMFNKLDIITACKLVTDAEIIELESKNNIVLPKSMKSFYMEINPIRVKQNVYSKGDNNIFYINGFYPISADTILNLDYILTERKWYFGSKYIAFADDPGGWEYVVSLTNENVYLCKMETSDIEASLIYICNGFKEFILGLKEESEI